MIVEYTRSGKTTHIEISDDHDWTDVLAWAMVKMGHTGTRTDDLVFTKMIGEKNGFVRAEAHPGIKYK